MKFEICIILYINCLEIKKGVHMLKKVRFLLISVLVFFAVGMFAGCTKTVNGKVNAVSTTSILADLVKQIGGDKVEVTGLMGPNVDAHDFELTSKHQKAVKKANVVFSSGMQLEGKAIDVLKNITIKSKGKFYAVGDELKKTLGVSEKGFIKSEEGHEHHHEHEHEHEEHNEHHHGDIDPHFWHDINLWKEAAKFVASKLSEINPKNAKVYEHNRDIYIEKLNNLEKELKEKVAKVSEEERVAITQHDAFAYLSRAFKINMIHIQGISTLAEVTDKHVQEVAKLAKERKAKAIFAEASTNNKGIDSVIAAAKAIGHELKKGGNLFADSLGTVEEGAGTYIDMMRKNVNTIMEAIK